ncbi:thymidylate synthase [Sphingomonas sp. ASV193]|uniref:thymidylate synthase n=1 Tax=Sphingomonas sp. ASV193 TaxID=3144405 RepID=UPI0032E87EED
MDEVQRWALATLLANGSPSAPRADRTIEMIGAGFRLLDPRARLITSAARRWSTALAVGEFAWHLSGSNEVAPIAYYASRWRDFSDDGFVIRGSCYGQRIFGPGGNGLSQWERLVHLLREDPESRRAVLNVQQSPELSLDAASRDVSCVNGCQFLLRDGRLHALLNMRSNDVIWGLPYDVFLFSMLQEMLSLELGVKLGSYIHVAGSFHLYERHREWALRIAEEQTIATSPMIPMDNIAELPDFLDAERNLRATGISTATLSPYWAALLKPLKAHAHRHATADPVEA